MKRIRRSSAFALAAMLAMLTASDAHAQVPMVARAGVINRRMPRAGANGAVNLPYTSSDNNGNQWMVYQPGTLQMQGNMPVYSQAGQLIINGNQPMMNNNQARIDDKTGELLLENMQVGGFQVSRRILFNTDDSYVRVIDIIKNAQPQDQQLNMQLTSNVNFGVQTATTVADPKHKDHVLAWVAQVNGIQRAAVDLYGGKNCKVVPNVTSQPGNNVVQANLTTTIPANKEIAIVHFHLTTATLDTGMQWVKSLKESALLADVPKEIRKSIINFKINQGLLGDLEVLRGDVLDVVELRSGDKFNGNLLEQSFKLNTFYGAVELPVDKVVGIFNIGVFKPRQLIVTSDGQIFGGHLEKPTIDLELSSGQKTQIPLAQISRVGYRKRAAETEDSEQAMLQPPYLLMSTGDRVGVAAPSVPIHAVTRYGTMQLTPEMISSIAFTSEDSGVHTFTLNDGSKFSGLVSEPEFLLQLTTGAKDPVKFPIGMLSRLMMKNLPDDRDDSAPILNLRKDDSMVGTMQGQLKLDTAFDTITVNAPEIRAMVHSSENGPDVSITTWDGAVFSGQLEDQEIPVHLGCGLDVRVPVSLIQSYANAQAQAPAMMLDRIKTITADLNADDFKQRDAAEKQLLALGPGVAATLKSMRDAQPPEAQQRIDSILKQLEKQAVAKPTGAGVSAPAINIRD